MNCVLFFMQRGKKLEGLPYLHRFGVMLHDFAVDYHILADGRLLLESIEINRLLDSIDGFVCK